MASYYIEMLSKNKSINVIKAKALILIGAIHIIISLLFDLVYTSIMFFVGE